MNFLFLEHIISKLLGKFSHDFLNVSAGKKYDNEI